MTLRNLFPSFGKKRVPVRCDYNSPFGLLHRDIDMLFDDFFNDFELDLFDGQKVSFSPRVEVSEDEKEGSSEKFMGDFRYRESTKCMI